MLFYERAGTHGVNAINALSNASVKTEREIGTGMQRMN